MFRRNKTTATPLYNGNISQIDWYFTDHFTANTYKYSYDGLSRIISAQYSNINNYDFSTSYTYDKNGNILSLKRNAFVNELNASTEIDNLTYYYRGNQTTFIDDINNTNHQQNGFTDNGAFYNNHIDPPQSKSIVYDYQYDANGNLIKDENKQITSIKYNYLNLPTSINFYSPEEKFKNICIFTQPQAQK